MVLSAPYGSGATMIRELRIRRDKSGLGFRCAYDQE